MAAVTKRVIKLDENSEKKLELLLILEKANLPATQKKDVEQVLMQKMIDSFYDSVNASEKLKEMV